jgi:phosphatidylethanolamine/phosphatidyl-N-methylethanolamine N-methyltransferase
MQGRSRSEMTTTKPGDGTRFFRSLVSAPRLIGAVAPSGRALARAMAAAVPPIGRGLIVELGPGTGPVTRALIERGVAKERLVLIEYDPGFCRMLRQRFAPAVTIEGDAYDLPGALADFAHGPIAAVVSSLPLLNQPPHRREKLIADAFALMGLEGVFVQFTYGLLSPIPRDVCAGHYSARGGAPIWRNLPPARVWTYRLDPREGAGEALEGRFSGRRTNFSHAASDR